MRGSALLRALALPVTFPLALLACYLVAGKQMQFDVGYAPWRRSQILVALGLVAPVSAGAAAWYASAQRSYRERLAASSSRRLAWWLIPTVFNALALTVAMILALFFIGRSGSDVLFVLHAFVVLFAASCFGFACGLRLSLVVAFPVALFAGWLPNLLVAMTPEWLRLLRGAANADCCSPGTVVSERVAASGLLAALGVALCSTAWLAGWRFSSRTRNGWILALGGGIACFVVAIGLVQGASSTALSSVRSADLTCDEGAPKLCSWHDGVVERRQAHSWFAHAADIATRTGVPLPAAITARPDARWPQTHLPFGYLGEQEGLRTQAYVSALVPQPSGCEDIRVLAAQQGLAQWWAEQLGASSLGSNLPGASATTKRLKSLAGVERQKYAKQLVDGIARCDAKGSFAK